MSVTEWVLDKPELLENDTERRAAQALYNSEVEVGYEGIGGFAAGQAEEVIAALRKAGFTLTELC